MGMCAKEESTAPDILAAGVYYGTVYRCRSNQGNSTSLMMNFIPVHAGTSGPVEAGGQTCITYYTNYTY